MIPKFEYIKMAEMIKSASMDKQAKGPFGLGNLALYGLAGYGLYRGALGVHDWHKRRQLARLQALQYSLAGGK